MPNESPKSTSGMVNYNRNSTAQKQAVNRHAKRIGTLIDRLKPAGAELRVTDYGCGPGLSTIGVARPAIEAFRRLAPDTPIAICHADQPGNDWNALFNLIHGPSGYLAGASGVRIEASVGSFYDRMASEGSVNLGTCFGASHWLREPVCLHSPGTLWFADLEGAARAQLAARARNDWSRFLCQRAGELQSGGFLLVSTLGAIPEASEINGLAASGRGIYRAMHSVAQDTARDGLIDQSVLDQFVFPIWFLSEQEAREPIETDPFLSKVFAIDELVVSPAQDNPTDIFAGFIDDPVAYGRHYADFVRAFADSTLRSQLFEPSAAADNDANALADAYYSRLEALCAGQPGQHAFEAWDLTLVLRRT